MTATATPTGSEAPPRFPVAVQFALLAGPLLSMVDSSIVNVAVEPIARELSAPVTAVQWTISAYLLAMGASLAGASWLARRFGTLPLYLCSLAAFTLASAACAAAPTIGLLIVARVIQGVFAAPLVPMAMSMLLGSGDTTRSISPLAGIMLFVGPALGPSIGGALIGLGGWRTIFLVNVPIGALAFLSARRIPASLAPGRNTTTRFDLPGLLLLAGGLAAILFGIQEREWIPLTVGLLLLLAYARWAARREHPALDLTLVRHRSSVLALTLCAAASVVTYAAVFLLPVFVQSVQHRSALATGVALLPQGIITGVSTALGQRGLVRFSVRSTVLAGFSVLTLASLGLLAIDASTPLWITAVILAARAASIGLVITPLLTVLLRPLSPPQLADANSLFTIWQRVAGSFGVAMISALFAAQVRTHGPVSGLHATAWAIVAVCAAAAAASLALPSIRNTAITVR